MSEKKIQGEGTPPLGKRSYVSEADLVENIKKANRGEEAKLPSQEVLNLFMAEALYDIREGINSLLEIFRSAKIEDKVVPVEATASVPVAPATPVEKTTGPIPVSNVDKVVAAFQKYGDMLTTDTESSAQFVIIKTTRRLESSDFAKVAKDVRDLGGEYISKGKDSHFKVPKLTVKEEEEVPRTTTSNKPIDVVKASFPAELEALLDFTPQGDKVVLKPKQFLGSDNFAKIASVVRALNGEYISAGKDSHFEVPVPKTS